MSGFTLGTKLATSQLFTPEGKRVAYTKIDTSVCHLLDIRTIERDGYMAAILGAVVTKNLRKSKLGLQKKAGVETPLRFFREIRLDRMPKTCSVSLLDVEGKRGLKINEVEVFIGDRLPIEALFAIGETVNTQSKSKGKGFQGVVRRHGFAGGPATHGQSDRERSPGSIGQSATPGRVYKGKKMAGKTGNQITTTKKARVLEVAPDYIMISGFVPGSDGTLVIVKSA